MKAIILAAGVGSRLRPITNYKPKTLVEVNGKPMLGYLMENLINNDIKDIIICIGYKGEQIKEFCIKNYSGVNINFVNNKDYLETNNMYSLYLAKDYLDEDIILMNADLVYEGDIIKGLLETTGSHVAIDKGTYDQESMKVAVNEENEIIDISKTIKEEGAYGRSIDVYKIEAKDLIVLKENLINIIEKEDDKNQRTEVLLQKLFQEGLIVAKPFLIKKNKWVEIDNYDDLHRGEILFNNNIEKLKSKKLFLLDKDGTVTIGNSVIDGANKFIRSLIKNNKNFCLLSNNSSKTPTENIKKFKRLGLEGFDKNNFILSTDIAIDYFLKNGIKRIYLLSNEKVKKLFEKKGFIIDENYPQALLLTYDTEIDYNKIKKFHLLLKQGIPYYSTHIDYVCPIEDGDIPDIGSFIRLFEISSGRTPNIVFGKPSKYIVDYIKDKYDIKTNEIVTIGDRLYTDIEQKKYGNIFSILVLTGESKREDVERYEIKPDLIITDLKELNKLLFENKDD